MGVSLKHKDINLIAALDRRQRAFREKKATAVRQPILILVLVLVLLGAGYYKLYTDTRALEKEKAAINLYLNDPTTVADYGESLKKQDQATRMAAQRDELGRVLLNLSSYPDIYKGDFDLIYEYADKRVGVSGVSYDRSTGVLSFNAECDTVTGVPLFVAQLRMSAIFDDIRYEGYTEQVTTNTTPGKTTKKWVPELGADEKPKIDANGNEIGYWEETTSTVTTTNKSYVFAITALVRSPEPHMPEPGAGTGAGAGAGTGR